MKINKLAGAYRQADENNAQLTRLYGVVFEGKEELKAYETMIEEAKKRDHRVLGKKLQLFAFSERVGA
jgi:threonyl-tRNA synthetase